MDGGRYTVEKMLQGALLKADEARSLLFFSLYQVLGSQK